MVKLIASDIDGTLLQGEETEISAKTFDNIRRLAAKNIAFCAASGRQYTSLRRLFAPVADDIYYICENGAMVYTRGEKHIICKTPMPRPLALKLIDEICKNPECEVLISGDDMSYLIPKTDEIVYLMSNFTGNNVTVVKNADEVACDIVKISAYVKNQSPAALEAAMGECWRKAGFNVAVAGEDWLDFTLADKGTGLDGLCKALKIGKENVMAFGDNYNDIPLLTAAGMPYIMQNAAPDLRLKFANSCADVNEILDKL